MPLLTGGPGTRRHKAGAGARRRGLGGTMRGAQEAVVARRRVQWEKHRSGSPPARSEHGADSDTVMFGVSLWRYLRVFTCTQGSNGTEAHKYTHQVCTAAFQQVKIYSGQKPTSRRGSLRTWNLMWCRGEGGTPRQPPASAPCQARMPRQALSGHDALRDGPRRSAPLTSHHRLAVSLAVSRVPSGSGSGARLLLRDAPVEAMGSTRCERAHPE
ncbi:hypothetical protein E2C01_071206 [Portunus trituberculatus]|uniref:Uncharacterized protein n=1 Tax=Portunus trituberculatus TaxID=210409 RepID=A0A5B7I7L7_PORTR|nr:hypothetical protein [Portunus trituberculatus]